jgi:hypothetical protein
LRWRATLASQRAFPFEAHQIALKLISGSPIAALGNRYLKTCDLLVKRGPGWWLCEQFAE